MLAPKWASQPLSGAGAARHGGRFNEPGMEALYISEDYITAIAEYEQELGIRPGTLCAYDVDLRGIVDLTDLQVQTICSVTTATLTCAWKEIWLVQKQRPPTWELAASLATDGYTGVRVPSVRHFSGVNLVLWQWNDHPDRHIAVLDPRSDLPTDQRSWSS
jgi:RES domain-containing protein